VAGLAWAAVHRALIMGRYDNHCSLLASTLPHWQPQFAIVIRIAIISLPHQSSVFVFISWWLTGGQEDQVVQYNLSLDIVLDMTL